MPIMRLIYILPDAIARPLLIAWGIVTLVCIAIGIAAHWHHF